MVAPKRFKHSTVAPAVVSTTKSPYAYSNHITEEHKKSIYDIKFCPFFDENIFAVASPAQVTIYQCIEKEILPRAVFTADKKKDEQFWAINWISQKCDDYTKIFLVIGNNHGLIRTVDPFCKKDNTIRMLIGHTRSINQISVHPIFPAIFASASEDFSIRLWHCQYETPLAVFLGHTDQVLCVNFHKTGEYLVSGSMDHTIRVWNIGASEELSTKIKLTKHGITFKNATTEISQCAAMTNEIHGNFVDCVEFIGAYIISKAADGYIAIWKFGEFKDTSPCGTPSALEPCATNNSLIAQLEIPYCNNWFIRFGITGHEMAETWVACGNLKQTVSIWNLRSEPLPTTSPYQIFHESFPNIIHGIGFSRDGNIMIAVGSDGRICRCDRISL